MAQEQNMPTYSEQEQIRREKLAALQEAGQDPYVLTKVDVTAHSAEINADYEKFEDQEVTIGIRPEGFELAGDGVLCCQLNNMEVMGRDVSIVSTHAASLNPVVRSIVDADNKVDITASTVRYNIKSHKIFLFNKETEERIYFEVK